MSPCQWSHSVVYSCTSIYFNIYLSIIYFTWCTTRYMIRQTCVPPNVTRSTKLWGTNHSLERAFRSMNFCVPENLIYLVLKTIVFLNYLKPFQFLMITGSIMFQIYYIIQLYLQRDVSESIFLFLSFTKWSKYKRSIDLLINVLPITVMIVGSRISVCTG